MDSTVLISKYLKEYNHIYKEANDIYHEIARKLQLSDSALDIFYTIFEIGRRLIHLYGNCRPTDISLFLPEKDEVCISILQLPARSLFRKSCFLSSRLKMIL